MFFAVAYLYIFFIDKVMIKIIIKFMSLNKIVIKIGTAVISDFETGINTHRLKNIVKNVSEIIKKQNAKVIIVSSGAVSSGMFVLNRSSRPQSLPEKQAIASIGQIFLMKRYTDEFNKYGLTISQVLLTNDLLTNRERFVNAKNTLNVLLDWGIVPVINENDTVSVEELRFGDNDRLAALVSILVDADLLLILSDVDGLYSDLPDKPGAYKIDYIEKIDKKIYSYASNVMSKFGTGGMQSKIKAAEVATRSGIDCIICNGQKDDAIARALNEQGFGTFFKAQKPIKARKRWLAFSAKSKGSIVIDKGAVEAVLKRGKSVLPIGIKKVDGNFKENDVIDVLSENGELIARGISFYSAEELDRIKEKKSTEVKKILKENFYEEAIHRDNLVIIKEG